MTNAQIIALLKKEIKPALGCTEPIAVALCVSRASEELKKNNINVETVQVELSANILKNGMGVGIPGTNMVGLDIASALGATCGKSKYRLEVLKDLTSNELLQAKKMVKENKITVKLSNTNLKLYVKAIVRGREKNSDKYHEAISIVQDNHDSIIYVSLDDQVIVDKASKVMDEISIQGDAGVATSSANEHLNLDIKRIYDFAVSVEYNDIAFILESGEMNMALSDDGMSHNYGLNIGRTIAASQNDCVYGKDTFLKYAMSKTAAASDARMSGSRLPAMSNSGSGNQGICATVPVMAVAEKMKADKEKLARALVLSNLTAIYIKGYLGKLSALCGCVVASTGSACGLIYLRGGGYENMTAAIKNMIGNISGIVCDGAKAGCALKVAAGVSTAFQSACLAMDNICISSNDGIIDEDVDKTIKNLALIGSKGMETVDKMILNIMINK